MRVNLLGPFQVHDAVGEDRTPKGMKERGLLCLLILSPGQRRTRVWLQSKLWSDSAPERASGSCRQALTNIRKALGPLGGRLKSDRSTVWIEPPVELAALAGCGELLSDIDVDDREFDDWLRDERQRNSGPTASARGATVSPTMDRRPKVVLRAPTPATSPSGTFLQCMLTQWLEGRLTAMGDVAIVDGASAEEDAVAVVEIETLDEAEHWFVLLRVYALPNRRCVWTGRLRLAARINDLWASNDLVRFMNRAAASVADLTSLNGSGTNFALIQRAVRRIYEFDRPALAQAECLLEKVQDHPAFGLSLAWRAFAKLTSVLEFRESGEENAAAAAALCDDALALMHNHPVVLAIASQVHLKLVGDTDRAFHLASRSVAAADDNPYALLALSLATFAQGDFDTGHDLAQRARHAAEGMPNATYWEMLCCLSTLSLGQFDQALDHVRAGQRQMPTYRPALRYLVALNLLTGNIEEALRFSDRLTRIEPDFEPRLLLSPDYPVETLRFLGLADGLRPILS